ncbi:mannan endo-1,4-beta-mannosidase [Paenibacillus sp. J45TS6]|uniref:glycosyl hydrolase n=1 Tax=unclassified Paenibacillus TaxID=185978 RepID=UPI001B258AE5|nr:glycosyl hydrolase [Paenibacillus sp. J45TS6]GIP43921.1 mannan endo-1,4-beta-mannosidase [Paenibacillus sp. J45TS6]
MKRKPLVIFLVLSMMAVLMPANESKLTAAPIVYEAEEAVLSGVEVLTEVEGYSGTGYVGGFDLAEDILTFEVSVPETALYNLEIGYSSPYGDKYTSLMINNKSQGEVALRQNSEFTQTQAGKILLQEGTNQISFLTNWGWYFIDYIRLEQASSPPPHNINKELVNSKASKEAKALYNYLKSEYGNHILSGQQTLADANWIEENIGKKPAVLGLDLMDYSPSRVERGTTSSDVEHAIQWDQEGGIVTFAWHWNAPKDLIDEPGKEWWRGFYTDATTFDLENALANKNSEDYKLLIRDMDVIAEELKRLEKAKVPVLWRPLHEAEGGWFWWGAKGPEPAKELYRIMYDRFTNVHKLNNLIWVWNSENPEWYPGDEYVDIVSVDSYPAAGDYGPVSNRYENLKTLVNDRKLVALTENGPIPDPDLLQIYRADWSWFVTWNGNFINDGLQNEREHLVKVYESPYVITMDELPDWKKKFKK